MDDAARRPVRRPTETQAFGTGRRENHDSSMFYDRFPPPKISDDDSLAQPFQLPNPACIVGDSRSMADLPDNSVALVVTSPPYFVGKEYEVAVADNQDSIPDTYIDYLAMLRDVFTECRRVLEPGGRIAVNVANLGRKPYRSLSSDIITILQDDLQLLLRGEVIWQKAEGATGSVAWGSFRLATNPVLRDVTERVIVASKGRFNRARTAKQRSGSGHPSASTLSTDEFMEATLDLWRIDPESARRVDHPAPFPVELPQRLIELYTYRDDVVLDPFLGSGSTVVAAQRCGRRGIGYDLEPDYVRSAIDRLERERYLVTTQSPYQQAAQTKLKMTDIVHETLSTSGFGDIATKPKIANTGLTCDFLLHSKSGQPYYVDVAGAFTTIRPGLLRSEAIWKMLGRASILRAQIPDARLLVLTSALPKPGSSLDKTIRAVGPEELFDVLALYDTNTIATLRSYAEDTETTPRFWAT